MEQTAHEKKMDKLKGQLDQNFLIEAQAMSAQQLKDLALKYTREIERIEDEKAADVELNTAKEQVKDLSAGYKDARKAAKAKMQYALGLITEQGG